LSASLVSFWSNSLTLVYFSLFFLVTHAPSLLSLLVYLFLFHHLSVSLSRLLSFPLHVFYLMSLFLALLLATTPEVPSKDEPESNEVGEVARKRTVTERKSGRPGQYVRPGYQLLCRRVCMQTFLHATSCSRYLVRTCREAILNGDHYVYNADDHARKTIGHHGFEKSSKHESE